MKSPLCAWRSLSRTARLLLQLGVSVVLLNVLAIAAAQMAVRQAWDNSQERAQVATRNMAQLLEQNITASFDQIDLVVRNVADEATRRAGAGAIDSASFNRYLAGQFARVPGMTGLRVTNAAGDLLYGTAPFPATPMNAARRDYFAELRRAPPDALVMSRPVLGPISGKWIIVLARRINGPDGTFAGVAFATVALQDIKNRLTSLDLGSNGAISLRGADLSLIVRHPGPLRQPTEAANRAISSELVSAVAAHPAAGVYDAPTALDQVRRRNAYRKSSHYPFYVIVGLATDDYLEEWRHGIVHAVALTSAFVLVTLLLAALIFRAWRRQETNVELMTRVIDQRKAAEQEVEHLAYFDALTHLPNRRLLIDRLQQSLADTARSQHQGALLYIDLDDFKTLNDTRGHDIGDQLLIEVGRRLIGCVREGDTAARLGGDEFLVMLKDLSVNRQEAARQAKNIGEKILATLNQVYILGAHTCHSTPSIGITLFRNHEDSVDELLKQADLAMYQAKAAGRNTLRFYDPATQAAVTARAALEEDLRDGMRKGQFILHYQAQVDGAGHLTGAEALVRWKHPVRGLVLPAEFIPLAEETGLILTLGAWVLHSACDQLVSWAATPATSHLVLAVNVSARQFLQSNFVAHVLDALKLSGANPERLKLELTESVLLDDIDGTIVKMTALKARGVRFSLDDFGTGYSSLSYLKRLPLDQLKIDQSFVRDALTDANDAAIARTIIALADSLGLEVIAEGVETVAQRDFLALHGCHAYQGYLYGMPGPAEALMQGSLLAPPQATT